MSDELASSRSSRSASGWTDANVHDPGITMLQLLVFSVAALVASRALIKRRRKRKPDDPD